MGGEDARYAQIWSSEQWVSQAGWLVGAQAFGRPLPPCASREIGYRWLNSLISLRHSSLTSPHNLSAGAEPHSGGDAIKDFADAGTCSHGAGHYQDGSYSKVILIQKILFLQLLHGFKLFHLVSVENLCISEASLHFRRPAPTWSMRRGSHTEQESKGKMGDFKRC